jgi:hypothetical protein
MKARHSYRIFVSPYISAGMAVGAKVRTDPAIASYVGTSILLVTLAAIAVRRLKTPWRWGLAGLLVLAAVGSGLSAHSLTRYVVVTPQYYQTIYRIEKLSASTDAWVERHGRPPTVAEWRAMQPIEETEDGWGRLLRYCPFDEKALGYIRNNESRKLAKRLGYIIWWPIDLQRNTPDVTELTNWHFGPDGLFGTADDEPALAHEMRYKPLDPMKYPHARAPRAGGVTDAH